MIEEIATEKEGLKLLAILMKSKTFNSAEIDRVLKAIDPDVLKNTFNLSHMKLIQGIKKVLSGKVTWKDDYYDSCMNGMDLNNYDPKSDIIDQFSGLFKFFFVTEIKKGVVFGEKGFQDNTKRQATVISTFFSTKIQRRMTVTWHTWIKTNTNRFLTMSRT
jgi:hypothetical protein